MHWQKGARISLDGKLLLPRSGGSRPATVILPQDVLPKILAISPKKLILPHHTSVVKSAKLYARM